MEGKLINLAQFHCTEVTRSVTWTTTRAGARKGNPMDIPKEFFTVQSMLTLTGATGATFVVANGIQRAFNYNPKWLALVVAESLAVFGVAATHGSGGDYFVGVVNGFLIYCTAAGATEVTGSGSQRAARVVERGAADVDSPTPSTRRGFLSSWFGP